jgi:hypothetical protein
MQILLKLIIIILKRLFFTKFVLSVDLDFTYIWLVYFHISEYYEVNFSKIL